VTGRAESAFAERRRDGKPDLRLPTCLFALILLSACSPREDPARVSQEPAPPLEIERYDCYALGRMQGVMVQQSALAAVHPAFEQPICSRWLLAWSAQWTAEVTRGDEGVRVQSRTFDHARSVELMLPADLGNLEQPMDPALSPAVVALAGQLASLQPDGLEDAPASVLLQSESFDLGEVYALVGAAPDAIEGRAVSVDATGQVRRDLEGATETVPADGVDWAWLFGTLPSAPDGAGPVAVPATAHLLPGFLLGDALDGFSATLVLPVVQDGTDATRGSLRLMPADRSVELSVLLGGLQVSREQGHGPVRHLAFSAALPAGVMETSARFAGVAWEGDLRLEVLYVAEKQAHRASSPGK
jgi:hypothetical protein